jgi:uncharacterized protein YqjF (DUF2071 family)
MIEADSKSRSVTALEPVAQHRPDAPVVGYQRWHEMLFLHWPVSAEALRPLVPPQLEIDLWDSRAWISFTLFSVKRARLRFLPPLPGAANFHEVNVRTYVQRESGDPGIWFFSLDAQSALAVIAARMSLRLPYFTAKISRTREGDSFHYRSSRRPSRHLAAITATWNAKGAAQPARPSSLERFLCERYVLYSRAAGKKLWRQQVHHQSWPLREVEGLKLQQTVDQADHLPALLSFPHAQYSEGVDVEFFPPRLV